MKSLLAFVVALFNSIFHPLTMRFATDPTMSDPGSGGDKFDVRMAPTLLAAGRSVAEAFTQGWADMVGVATFTGPQRPTVMDC